MPEKRIGVVEHYYGKAHAAVVDLEDDIHVGDRIHIVGHGVDFTETVQSLQMDHKPVKEGHRGEHIGLAVIQPVKEKAEVYLVKAT